MDCDGELAVPYGYNSGFEQVYRNIQRSRVRPSFENLQLTIHLDDIADFIEFRLDDRTHGGLYGHLSDGIIRNSEDFLNAMELRGPTALRLPLAKVPLGSDRANVGTFRDLVDASALCPCVKLTSSGLKTRLEIEFSPQINWKVTGLMLKGQLTPRNLSQSLGTTVRNEVSSEEIHLVFLLSALEGSWHTQCRTLIRCDRPVSAQQSKRAVSSKAEWMAETSMKKWRKQ